MKIIEIKYLETFIPKGCSCGTGYSEPDKFHIICDDNLYKNDIWHKDSNEKDIWIDTWYISGESSIFNIFKNTIYKEIGIIDNIYEAFEMYKKSLNYINK